MLAVFVIAALITIRFFYRSNKRERVARGNCVNCGYDLRQTGDRCPECGRWSLPKSRVQTGPLNREAMQNALTTAPVVAREPAQHEKYFAVFEATDRDEVEQLREFLLHRGVVSEIRRPRALNFAPMVDSDTALPIFRTIIREGDRDVVLEFIQFLKRT